MAKRHKERHRLARIGWLRAAVLGANDGIVSTASLVVGVSATHASSTEIAAAGVAGLVAGAMSMAAGEYVSVKSQADTEEADLARERRELATENEAEHVELAKIYASRGLEPALAKEVAKQLMAHDALGAHARDELGIVEEQRARPLLAAMSSAGAFSAGAIVPVALALVVPHAAVAISVVATSLVALAVLGVLAARAGGAPAGPGAWRVAMWGAVAMALTYGAGALFGAVA